MLVDCKVEIVVDTLRILVLTDPVNVIVLEIETEVDVTCAVVVEREAELLPNWVVALAKFAFTAVVMAVTRLAVVVSVD